VEEPLKISPTDLMEPFEIEDGSETEGCPFPGEKMGVADPGVELT